MPNYESINVIRQSLLWKLDFNRFLTVTFISSLLTPLEGFAFKRICFNFPFKIQFHSFICEYSVAPSPFVRLFFSLLNSFGTTVSLGRDVWVHFWTFSTIGLYVYSMLGTHSSDHCKFVVNFEIWKCESSSFCNIVLFKKPPAIPCEFKHQLFHVWKKKKKL